VVDREVIKGEQVLFGFLEQRRDLRQRLAQPVERFADALACMLTAFGVEQRVGPTNSYRC
jgi:hypothetical protein